MIAVTESQTGATLTQGPSDWQILQQDREGAADLALQGRWAHEGPGRVEVRLVRAALGMAHGRPVDWAAPDLQAARLGPDRRSVELVFAPVRSRMEALDPEANLLRVEDEHGAVSVEKVVYCQDARVQLVLGRAPAGRTVVHGGYGTAPEMVPMDVERLLPMLGFYGAPVE